MDVSIFRTAAAAGFVAVAAAILLHFIASKPKFDDVFGRDRKGHILDPLRLVIFFVTLLFVEQKRSLLGVLRKVVFLLAVLCFAVLAVTGFVPRVVFGSAITSWWLMVHAMVAPIFAVCVAILAVLWADRNRLDKNYWPLLNRIIGRNPKSTVAPERHELKLRICFWVILAMSLPVVLSAVVGIFTIFGTQGQEVLLQIHRYSTLLLSLFAIIYLYLAALTEMNKVAAK